MNMRKVNAYKKKANPLSADELSKLGIEAEMDIEGMGFVDTSSEQVKKLESLCKTGKYHFHTYMCEGRIDYFATGAHRVNRMGYGLCHGAFKDVMY